MEHQTEELLNDPGNHAILKSLASEEELDFKKLKKKTGIKEKRLREKLETLEKEGYMEVRRTTHPLNTAFRQEHREQLEDVRDGIEKFMEDKKDLVEKENSRELERLKDVRQRLQQEIEETDLVPKEKRLESRMESVNKSIEMIQGSEGATENFRAFSHAHRTLRHLGYRDDEFGSFNPFRKMKLARKLDEVLEQEPEQERIRKFFGSRWITEDKLDQTG